ncbi:MAG TPA: hypothetical protein VNE61_11615 [Ktedonobacteraceae bacterium]|nr:hypothetical protein [Ktedonobacteraceae bacterium]
MQNMNRKARGGMQVIRRQSIFFIIPLTLLLAFVLAACGSNGGTTTGAPAGNTPTTTPTSVSSTAAHGCPGGVAANPPQGSANVIVQFKKSENTVTAHKGDVIEVRLPFGQVWSGPTTSQGVLQLQTPYGYASAAAKACIWRFTAVATGTTQLSFSGRAPCPKGAMCAMYVLLAHFTIDVK